MFKDSPPPIVACSTLATPRECETNLLGAARTVYYGSTPHNLDNFGDGVYFANMWDGGWHASGYNAPNMNAWVAILSYTSDPTVKIQIALGNHGEVQIRFYIKDETPYWKAWTVIHS